MTESVKVPFLDLRLREDAGAVRDAFARVTARGWYVLGPEVAAFESEFATASGLKFAVGTGTGTGTCGTGTAVGTGTTVGTDGTVGTGGS